MLKRSLNLRHGPSFCLGLGSGKHQFFLVWANPKMNRRWVCLFVVAIAHLAMVQALRIDVKYPDKQARFLASFDPFPASKLPNAHSC